MKYECDCGKVFTDPDGPIMCADSHHGQPTKTTGDPMKEIVIGLVETISQYLGGRGTDCGGELDNVECSPCKHYWQCKRNYDFADALDNLKRLAEEVKNVNE
jgi:hypothetical protein